MKIKKYPRIAIAGSVNSSLQTLRKLNEHKCDVCAVLGLAPEAAQKVSGYQDIKAAGERLGYSSTYFQKINERSVLEFLEDKEVDLLFVVGLSQMVKEPLLSLPSVGLVGFHPTKLPQGRGRAAIAWMILGKAPGAATFFLMDEGMDSGPILGQSPFTVTNEDYAQDVVSKIKGAIDEVLDQMLHKLKAGKLEVEEQDHEKASYMGVRKPNDGWIDWHQTARFVYDLIRATSSPLPGAFAYYEDRKVVIWRASILSNYTGIPGRIIDFKESNPVVCCGEGALLLEEYETVSEGVKFRIGKEFT